MEPGDYAAYAARATYYNFSGRTVSSMSGAIFHRIPLIENVPAPLEPRLKTIAKDCGDFDTFVSGTGEEVIRMGRYGVLVDLPARVTTTPRPYFAGYTAENILDWDEDEDDDGRRRLTRLVLRETNDSRDGPTSNRVAYAAYRELLLVPGPVAGQMIYQQFIYSAVGRDATLSDTDRTGPITPLRMGVPLNFIPFRIFGPHVSSMSVEKPPMEDIAMLNLSHYHSYAYLEHGRFFVGFPVYTAEEPQGGGEVDYRLGSSRVWVLPSGGKAHILEMKGQGLKFLENALAQKEMQAVSIGSKMMGGGAPGPAKGPDRLLLEERNEQSALLKITRQLDRNFTQLLRWWAWWQGESQETVDKIEITFNKDFLFDGAGDREFRPIEQMYKDGIIPIDVVYYYLKKGNVIPDWMKQDEFEQLLNKMSSFPNQPDAEARGEGFQSRQQQLSHEEKLAGIDIQQQEIDLQTEVEAAATKLADAQHKLATKQAATAAKTAAAAAKAPAAPLACPIAKVAPPSVAVASVKPIGKPMRDTRTGMTLADASVRVCALRRCAVGVEWEPPCFPALDEDPLWDVARKDYEIKTPVVLPAPLTRSWVYLLGGMGVRPH